MIFWLFCVVIVFMLFTRHEHTRNFLGINFYTNLLTRDYENFCVLLAINVGFEPSKLKLLAKIRS